jgi:hypothetical protein
MALLLDEGSEKQWRRPSGAFRTARSEQWHRPRLYDQGGGNSTLTLAFSRGINSLLRNGGTWAWHSDYRAVIFACFAALREVLFG